MKTILISASVALAMLAGSTAVAAKKVPDGIVAFKKTPFDFKKTPFDFKKTPYDFKKTPFDFNNAPDGLTAD